MINENNTKTNDNYANELSNAWMTTNDNTFETFSNYNSFFYKNSIRLLN